MKNASRRWRKLRTAAACTHRRGCAGSTANWRSDPLSRGINTRLPTSQPSALLYWARIPERQFPTIHNILRDGSVMYRRDQPLECEEAKCPYVADYINVPVQPVMQLVETLRGLGRLAPRSKGEINDNNKGDATCFAGHCDQCPGRERFFHRGDLPSGSRGACRLHSNRGVAAISHVRGGAHNSAGFVCIGGNLQTSDVCVADPGHARGRHAIAGCRNRSVSA